VGVSEADEASHKSDAQAIPDLLMDSFSSDPYEELLSASRARHIWLNAGRAPGNDPADLSRGIDAE
jgi:hypothetical protein